LTRRPSALFGSASRSRCLLLIAPIGIVVAISFSGDGSLAFPAALLVAPVARALPRRRALAEVALELRRDRGGASLLGTGAGFLAAYAFVRGGFR
jgi:ABC-type spermidine/putrescine transport system permease subunit II